MKSCCMRAHASYTELFARQKMPDRQIVPHTDKKMPGSVRNPAIEVAAALRQSKTYRNNDKITCGA